MYVFVFYLLCVKFLPTFLCPIFFIVAFFCSPVCIFLFLFISGLGAPSLTSHPANAQLVIFLSDGNWWVVLYLYLSLYFSHLFFLLIFVQKYAHSFPFGQCSLSSDSSWWSVLVVDQADVNVKRHFHPLANLFRGFFSLSHWSLRGRWWRWVRQWSELLEEWFLNTNSQLPQIVDWLFLQIWLSQ